MKPEYSNEILQVKLDNRIFHIGDLYNHQTIYEIKKSEKGYFYLIGGENVLASVSFGKSTVEMLYYPASSDTDICIGEFDLFEKKYAIVCRNEKAVKNLCSTHGIMIDKLHTITETKLSVFYLFGHYKKFDIIEYHLCLD